MTTEIRTIDIKGTAYATVNARLTYFRENHQDYRLISEIISDKDGTVIIKASILNEKGDILATGHACEKDGVGFINKTSHVENCETSAWGRALGNFGIGISAAVASYEEVANAIEQRKPVTKEKKYKEDVCAKEETIKKESLKEMLPECATVQETIDIWWLLTEKQQKDVETKGWFSARKSQLNDEGIYG